jgi:hypothetical protein
VGGKQDPRADLVQILPGIDSDPVLITAKAAFPLWGRYARDSLPLAHQQASISLPAAVSSVARLAVKSASWEIPNHCADMDSIGSGCCRPLPFSIIIDRHWGGAASWLQLSICLSRPGWFSADESSFSRWMFSEMSETLSPADFAHKLAGL